jgi:hypothetical protein
MKKSLRDLINGVNAEKSTGPKTPEGKQRASMNAFKHGLTGNRILLQTHEHEAYRQLTNALNKDLQPKAELERQLVQKLIDCHTRLNRIAALDGNILNFSLTQNETAADHDDALETIAAQCRAWIENADSFEKLGRYEARISRQLLQYTAELERLQKIRRFHEAMERDGVSTHPSQPTETKPPADESASFGKPPSETSAPPESDPPQPEPSPNNPNPPVPRANVLEHRPQ